MIEASDPLGEPALAGNVTALRLVQTRLETLPTLEPATLVLQRILLDPARLHNHGTQECPSTSAASFHDSSEPNRSC